MLRLRSRSDDGGFWYREGLAAYFEGEGCYRFNGTVRAARLGVLEVLYARDALPELDALLALDRRHTEEHAAAVRDYALAWSFCHFLLHGARGAYRERFVAFLDGVRGRDHAERMAAAFGQVFPDRESLRRDWARHVHTLVRGDPVVLRAELAPIGTRAHEEGTPTARELRPTVVAPPAVAGGGASAAVAADVWARIRDLPEHFAEERWQELRDALRADERRLGALVALAVGGPEANRLTAIRALGLADARQAQGCLVGLALDDESAAVRRVAAEAVRRLSHGLAPLALEDALLASGPVRATFAAEALAIVGDAGSARALVRALGRLPVPTVGFSVGAQRQPRPMIIRGSSGRRTYSFRREAGGEAGGTSLQVAPSPGSKTLEAALLAALGATVPEVRHVTAEEWLAWGRRQGLL